MRFNTRGAAGLGLPLALLVPPAQAGLFDDEEARKAILDLRQRIEQNAEQARARQAEPGHELHRKHPCFLT